MAADESEGIAAFTVRIRSGDIDILQLEARSAGGELKEMIPIGDVGANLQTRAVEVEIVLGDVDDDFARYSDCRTSGINNNTLTLRGGRKGRAQTGFVADTPQATAGAPAATGRKIDSDRFDLIDVTIILTRICATSVPLP